MCVCPCALALIWWSEIDMESSFALCSSLFWDMDSHWTWSSLANKWDSGICLSPPSPQTLELQVYTTHLVFYMDARDSDLFTVPSPYPHKPNRYNRRSEPAIKMENRRVTSPLWSKPKSGPALQVGIEASPETGAVGPRVEEDWGWGWWGWWNLKMGLETSLV